MQNNVAKAFLVGGVIGAATSWVLNMNVPNTRKIKKSMLKTGKKLLMGQLWS